MIKWFFQCITIGMISFYGIIVFALPVNPPLISFSSAKGQQIFLNSPYKDDFFSLSRYFVTQKNLSYCGIASAVMVLNALGVEAPPTSQYAPYKIFTQNNIFTPAVLNIITPAKAAALGVTLKGLSDILTAFPGVKVKIYYADNQGSEGLFKIVALSALKNDDNEFVIVNYARDRMNEDGEGHISPVAAYDSDSDMFLIMDVSRYKYPPVWVPTKLLWDAMSTQDKASGLYRGFLVVSK